MVAKIVKFRLFNIVFKKNLGDKILRKKKLDSFKMLFLFFLLQTSFV